MTGQLPIIDDPPVEDSPDLTDEEIERAIPTGDAHDLARALIEEIRRSKGFAVRRYENRRRGDRLFWRVRLVAPKEPDKVLVFSVDWLGKETGDDHLQRRFFEQFDPK